MRIFERKIAEDQRYILGEIVKILKKEKPDGVFISGDIYDRPVPPEESVDMLNDFLSQIHALGQDIYIISGNHDSPERIGFGGIGLMNGACHVDNRDCEPYTNNHWFGDERDGRNYIKTFQRGTVFPGETKPESQPQKKTMKVTIEYDDHIFSGLLEER